MTCMVTVLTLVLAAAAALALAGCGKKAPAPPTLSSLTPASQTAGGKITLAGSGFGNTQGEGKVRVGLEAASVESWSSSSIVIVVPPGLQPGAYQVSVTTSGGASGSLPLQVSSDPAPPPPHIASLQPASGPPDTRVTIFGSGFGAAQGGGRVNMGTAQMVVSSWSDHRLEVSVPPAMGAGQYQVTVANPNGTSNEMAFMVTARVEDRQLQEQAVSEDMNRNGINPGEWVFQQAKTSAGDPAWALLDYQRFEGMAHTQYLLHKVGGAWTVVASGGDDFDPQAHGAPADLRFF